MCSLFKQGNPVDTNLERYVEHTYNWAFNTWSESVWQEFSLNGKRVGAPVFIVNVTQSPNYPGEVNEREFRSIWNQAWFSSLRSASGLFRYARRTKELALSFPQTNGFFPGWLHRETFKPMHHLNESSETSLSSTFLLKLHELTGDERYKEAALKSIDAVVREIVPTGRWEDFETYWSCSRYGSEHLIGKKVERNNMYKQNNFSMFWTAEALMESFRSTGEKRYLYLGQRTLDELLMTQASWQPPYMYVNVLGGFGVLNADAEWNDSRQSLFAELIMQYGELRSRRSHESRRRRYGGIHYL